MMNVNNKIDELSQLVKKVLKKQQILINEIEKSLEAINKMKEQENVISKKIDTIKGKYKFHKFLVFLAFLLASFIVSTISKVTETAMFMPAFKYFLYETLKLVSFSIPLVSFFEVYKNYKEKEPELEELEEDIHLLQHNILAERLFKNQKIKLVQEYKILIDEALLSLKNLKQEISLLYDFSYQEDFKIVLETKEEEAKILKKLKDVKSDLL